MEDEAQVWRRNAALSALRPFDQANRIIAKILIHPRIEKFLWRLEAIKIKVI